MKANGHLRFRPIILLTALSMLFFGCSKQKENAPVVTPPAVVTKNGPIFETDLGLPIYPNAAANQNESFSSRADQVAAKRQIKTASASFTTTDSVEKVEQFYRDKLGSKGNISEHKSSSGKLVDIFMQEEGKEIRAQIVPLASGKGSVIVILTQARHQ